MSGSRMLVALVAGVLAAVAAAPAWAGGGHGGDARHSLRQPVTDQNFYFVMADRFQNGSADNDHGGLPPGKSEGQSGFDPAGKGWYHGGDLAGLRGKLGYIKGLGTTAIWLTPSFKNKAVQDNNGFPSAGYHGYWITDFEQIDPHLGTNDELRLLIRDAHRLGMKVYFDVITNHTADVIRYQEGAATTYVSKDRYPYRTAAGTVFDDRDFAGAGTFPALAPSGQPPCPRPESEPLRSFPYRPCVPAVEQDVKVPAWLNDVSLYHNRGNTTFAGENSQYGDFFGLDDLFTENRRVVDGMIDIYKFWIKEFRVDGFRMDTMKHVDDEFWERFAPAIERYAQAQGIRDFYMFGEVAEDFSHEIVSHYPTQTNVQGVLDFLFQMSAMDFAAESQPTHALRDFFVKDDWYTDADSNVYNLPTFLGNHDRGRVGMFVRNANAGASEAELLARDRLAHELMYLSRGNPVVYYGDEQGFTGAGGDQDARQDMFPSQSPQYNNLDDPITGDDGAGRNDNIGSGETPMDDNFDAGHPLYRKVAELASLTKRHGALRDGAQQHRFSTNGPGVYAFSRLDREHPHEYVVALNNSESTRTAAVPTYMSHGRFSRVYGSGASSPRSDAAGRLSVTVPALSAVVYRAEDHVPRSRRAPEIALKLPSGPARDRAEIGAEVSGSSFYEVTFLAREGKRWKAIGTDDNAPYRVFGDIADEKPGTRIEYKAVVLDNAGHTRTSRERSLTVAPPSLTITSPREGANVRGFVDLTSEVVPEHSSDVVVFERQIEDGPWTRVGTDSSSPVYTLHDEFSPDLATGTIIRYRATLNGVVTATRSVRVQRDQITTAVVHYIRGEDRAGWGLHLWGDGLAPGVATDWAAPRMPTRVENGEAIFEIPLVDDTDAVNFIIHAPGADPREPSTNGDGSRSFIPLDRQEVWVRTGDPATYFAPPG